MKTAPSRSLGPLGLDIDESKQDAIEAADLQGNSFMAFFTTFGSFSIAAGILLIFLVFVMLATERRGELGIARAIGTRRGHLVQMFTFEGVAYDLIAALVGALLGVAVAFLMVLVMSRAFNTAAGGDFEIEFAVSAAEPRHRLRPRRSAHARGRRGLRLAREHDDDLGGDPEPAGAARRRAGGAGSSWRDPGSPWAGYSPCPGSRASRPRPRRSCSESR